MGILTEILVCEDMALCTDLSRCHMHVVYQITTLCRIATVYYTVVASIFLVSTASSKAICSQNLRLFSAKWTHPSNATRTN